MTQTDDYAKAVLAAAQQLDRAIDQASLSGLRVTLAIRKQIRVPGPSCPGVAVTVECVERLGVWDGISHRELAKREKH